ncbi:MAG: hypothetical protein EAZ43_02185 [Betaproteobacteria bacterium]|nr:MAG: hypothetical protein EAZ43_02185 [Betaproteobacteria bacterium]
MALTDADVFYWWAVDQDFHFRKLAIARLSVLQGWKLARHEYLSLNSAGRASVLQASIQYGTGGYRSRNRDTHDRDLDALRQSLSHATVRTDWARAKLYIALTYESTKQFSLAREHFDAIVVNQCTDDDLIWQAKWGSARCIERLYPEGDARVVESFVALQKLNATRAEPLLALSRHAQALGSLDAAVTLAREARHCRVPTIFQTSMYDHAAYTWYREAMLVDAYLSRQRRGDRFRARSHAELALTHLTLPDEQRSRLITLANQA